MKRSCGKKGCKCQKGKKHVSLYVAYNENGKRKMRFIAKPLLKEIQLAVGRNKEFKKLSNILSLNNLKRLLERERKN